MKQLKIMDVLNLLQIFELQLTNIKLESRKVKNLLWIMRSQKWIRELKEKKHIERSIPDTRHTIKSHDIF